MVNQCRRTDEQESERGYPHRMDALTTVSDQLGRGLRDLRISVTDRCNFRCQYCMPAEGLPWLERAEVLTFEEISRLVSDFGSL